MRRTMDNQKIDLLVSKTLRIGIRSSSFLLLVGFILIALHPSILHLPVPTAGDTIRSLTTWNSLLLSVTFPYAFLYAGIFLLMLTPIARLIVALYGYVLEKDRMFILVSLFVLCVIVGSIVYSFIASR